MWRWSIKSQTSSGSTPITIPRILLQKCGLVLESPTAFSLPRTYFHPQAESLMVARAATVTSIPGLLHSSNSVRKPWLCKISCLYFYGREKWPGGDKCSFSCRSRGISAQHQLVAFCDTFNAPLCALCFGGARRAPSLAIGYFFSCPNRENMSTCHDQ